MTSTVQEFQANGFVLLPGAVDPALCAAFGKAVIDECERLEAAGWRFAGAGRIAGHLNIRMGSAGRDLHEGFHAAGLEGLVAELAGEPIQLVQAVGNLNRPGSCFQDFHMDGSFDQPSMIANICLVPTTVINGATEMVPASHLRELSYWRFARDGWKGKARTLDMMPGDVVIRLSSLWHRGTPNRSALARPMAAFSYAPQRFLAGAEACADLEGPLTLFANKYYGRWRSAKELLAARLPLLDEGLRQARSFILARDLGRND